MPQPLPLVIAHRGASASAPENTLEAFRQAFDRFKVDMIEFDVHISKDGVPVILHDARLERTTAGKGYVSKYAASELKIFNIPTLEEVFEAFPGKSFAIEVKENSAELTRTVMGLVNKFKAGPRVIVGSKHHAVFEEMRKNFPGVPRFASQRVVIAAIVDFKRGVKNPSEDPLTAASIPVERLGFRLDQERLIRYFHRKKMRLFFWTINDALSMKALWARGADGIITNHPALLNQVLGRCGTDPTTV